jgi:hypothetical protein
MEILHPEDPDYLEKALQWVKEWQAEMDAPETPASTVKE